jgi:hypothetical protein
MKSLADPSVLQSILDRVARAQPDGRALWGRMSAHQMIYHLSDSFRAAMGEKHVSPATGMLQSTVLKWFALYAPIEWPKGIPTRPEMDQGVGGTPPSDFDRDRADLVALTEKFCSGSPDIKWSSHPIFGELERTERLRWGYLHMDHHLRQFGF